MDHFGKVLVLGFVLSAAGCGGGSDDQNAGSPGDPGQAGTTFGPKMGGLMLLSATESVQVFGTAAAVQKDGRLHLFFIPQKASNPSFSRAYLSVWLPGMAWSPGIIDLATTQDLGARMEFVTLDGRAYELDLSRTPPVGEIRVEILSATPSDDGSHTYLTGALQARLESKTPGQPGIDAAFDINFPDEE